VGAKTNRQGWRIVFCYEAGPFGYVLHRQLAALGVTNYVIRPRDWDDQHQRVKTGPTEVGTTVLLIPVMGMGVQTGVARFVVEYNW
jgi:hypothetical protein